ncbi:uncharacterized protein N0V89_004041 [Didymosphaeria variabile]|uniref:Uncharacterized protein n=1 Tax=Didymosphaeria variabile TaxID=1932322 RepID=A0A9W8XRP7_9PLEO|nr:uncharacterized protein N0V89_004041 [Didymosphaeria variabile]KAJ4356015.1 hypothetical protein N0V89_004041 [Didymosphaeria variabile]
MLVIPGYLPITTTLNPTQLGELLPILHIYIDPALPNIALLPAASISYNGLEQALRWREAEIEQGSYEGMESNLIEIIEIYQALAFLGNKPTSQNLWSLDRVIRAAFEDGLLLAECQHMWALRYLPHTENWIDLMFRRLATDYESGVADAMDELAFYGRLEADEELRAMCTEILSIFEWIDEDDELLRRLKCVEARMVMEAKRARRIAKMSKMRHGRSSAPGQLWPQKEYSLPIINKPASGESWVPRLFDMVSKEKSSSSVNMKYYEHNRRLKCRKTIENGCRLRTVRSGSRNPIYPPHTPESDALGLTREKYNMIISNIEDFRHNTKSKCYSTCLTPWNKMRGRNTVDALEKVSDSIRQINGEDRRVVWTIEKIPGVYEQGMSCGKEGWEISAWNGEDPLELLI